MDAVLQVRVKIVARDAIAQLNALRAATDRVVTGTKPFETGFGRAHAAVTRFNNALASGLHRMESFGKNMQWTGRQIMYVFTLPLIGAGAAAAKFAMDNEKAMTDVRKVYDDTGLTASELEAELQALGKSFRLLSDRFGIAQADAIGIGRDWAQAGSAGVALAKGTRLTMEAMIVGSMDAKKATEGLIAVQASYQLSTDNLRKSLELMNAVENSTATDMKDLIESVQKAGGTARTAGVDIRYLMAMTAALIPAAGNASEAGNSLKTIISRIMAPTRQAANAMKDAGIEVDGLGWQSMNAHERLLKLSEVMKGLPATEKSWVAAAVAGRRQQSRFIQLMNEMASSTGFYAKALKATSSQEKAHATYRRELLTYLNSTPQRFQILTQTIKNFLADAIVPLLPSLVGAMAAVARLAKSFSELSPRTQKFITLGLLVIAVLGPIIQFLGASILLLAQFGKGFLFITRTIGLFLKTGSLMGKVFLTPVARVFGAFQMLAAQSGGGAAAAMGEAATASATAWTESMGVSAEVLRQFMFFVGVVTQVLSEEVSTDLVVVATTAATAASSAMEEMAVAATLAAGETIAALTTMVSNGALVLVTETETALVVMTTAVETSMGMLTSSIMGMAALVAGATAEEAHAVAAIWVGLFGTVERVFVASMTEITRIVSATTASLEAEASIQASIMEALFGWIRVQALETMATVSGALELWGGAIADGAALFVVGMEAATTRAVVAWDAAMLEMFASFQAFFAAVNSGILELTVGTAAALPVLVTHTQAVVLAMATSWSVALAEMLGATLATTAEMGAAFGAVGMAAIEAAVIDVESWEVAGALTAGSAEAAAAAAIVAVEAQTGAVVAAATTQAGAVIAATATEVEAVTAGAAASAGAWAAAWAAIASLPAWAIGAILAALAAIIVGSVLLVNRDLRDRILDALRAIGRGIAGLPRVFADALLAVGRVVRRAVKNILDMLSYLNPFQRHSPSMVDNVTAGINVILDQYRRLRQIGPMLRGAAAAHNAFLVATAPARANAQSRERAEQRQAVAEVAPEALPAFDQEIRHIAILEAALGPLEDQIAAQESVVKRWQRAVDDMNARLRDETRTLQLLGYQLDDLKDGIKAHRDAIDELLRTPLTGMNAMSDAIFENEMAQKRLRLAILETTAAANGQFDSIADRLARLAGEIETLRAQQTDLRLAGAGSDVLGPITDQINALEAEQNQIEGQAGALNDLQRQLEELQREGERLDLTNSITFDPQLRELDILANRMEELPFDEVRRRLLEHRDAIAAMQPQLDRVQAQYDAQSVIVEQLRRQQEGLNYELDVQQDKLEALQDTYREIKDLIDEMESSLIDMTNVASSAKSASSAAGDADRAFGDFDIPEATGMLGREGGLLDIEAFNADLQKEIDDMMRGMGDFDIFGGIKERFREFMDDFRRGLGVIGGWFSSAWNGMKTVALGVWNALATAWSVVWGAIVAVVSGAWNIISTIFMAIWNTITSILGPVFTWLWETIIQPVWNAIATAATWLWETILQPVFTAIGEFISSYVVPIFQAVGAVVTIVVVLIARMFQWLWENVLSDIFHLIGVAFSGLWAGAQWVYNNVVMPIASGIGTVFQWTWNNVLRPVWDAMRAGFQGTWNGIQWVYDNVIKPIASGLGTAFQWTWDHVLKPIWDAFGDAIDRVGDALTWLRDHVISPVMNGISTVMKNIINGLLSAIGGFGNLFIDVFNLIARGINRVAGIVHVNVHVDEMPRITVPRFEAGGNLPASVVGSGFKTDGIRAIVGEGNPRYPEYVVPTDPRFRMRALDLWRLLSNDLGITGLASGGTVPKLGIGDVLGGVGHAIGSGASALAGAGRKAAVTTIFGPIVTAVNAILDRIPVDFIRQTGHSLVNGAYDWAKGDPVHFARGGRFSVPRTPGGVNMLVGEGRSGEQIQVLPYDGDDGGRVINFYGDLSFPNITSGDDAEEFIKNLERLTNG